MPLFFFSGIRTYLARKQYKKLYIAQKTSAVQLQKGKFMYSVLLAVRIFVR